MISTFPCWKTPTQEYVVPRSIPTATLPILCLSLENNIITVHANILSSTIGGNRYCWPWRYNLQVSNVTRKTTCYPTRYVLEDSALINIVFVEICKKILDRCSENYTMEDNSKLNIYCHLVALFFFFFIGINPKKAWE